MEGLLLAVAAVIVTYNSADVIVSCIEALSKMAPEITPIIVDNASSDNTVERVRSRGGTVIANSENRGFGAAVNQGVREAGGYQFILLLNPDVALLTPVDQLRESAQLHGLAAGRLVDKAGRTQAGFTLRRFPTPASLICELFGINRLWPSNQVNRQYRYQDRGLDQPGPVEQPAGAFLMLRRDVWTELDGFDEQFYPVWFEDVDLCQRAVDAGYQIEYVPTVIARHKGGHSVGKISGDRRATYWCVSLLRYAAKHFQSEEFRLICAAVALTSIPRMVVGMIESRTLSSVGTYLKIMRFAGLCLVSPQKIRDTAVTDI
ncbi:MAG: glycosyltransferase family 2 protein [Acidobacteriota bacterium]